MIIFLVISWILSGIIISNVWYLREFPENDYTLGDFLTYSLPGSIFGPFVILIEITIMLVSKIPYNKVLIKGKHD